MNVFLIAWNLSKDQVPVVREEVNKIHDTYPLLDPNSIWSFNDNNKVYATSMCTAQSAAFPRNYVDKKDKQVTLYDGCVIDRTETFDAHKAEKLCAHWGDLPQYLEGRYVAARICSEPSQIEIITDPLGVYQTYYLHKNGTWLISNNVGLLERIGNVSVFDPLGVSLFLCLGWVGSDRTLKHQIRVLPGGQRWMWREGNNEPSRETYFSSVKLLAQRSKEKSTVNIEQLSTELTQNLRSLATTFGYVKCPLTAGHDTRVLASLLMRGGVETQYYCEGNPDSIDIRISSQIAKRFGLKYTTSSKTDSEFSDNWEEASSRLIRQTDGMTHLGLIKSALASPSSLSRLEISLNGNGGELGRKKYTGLKFLMQRHNIKTVKQHLVRCLIKNYFCLAKQAAVAQAIEYIEDFVEIVIDDGVAPVDVPAAFHACDRIPRWVGAGYRPGASFVDRFSPFCTRPFVEAALTLSPLHRDSERVHYQLISHLVPDLHEFPSDKKWPPQQTFRLLMDWSKSRLGNKLRTMIKKLPMTVSNSSKKQLWPAYDRANWIANKYPYFRELCLEQSNSPLWDYVDRTKFEQITSQPVLKDPRLRRQQFFELLNVITIFQYAKLTDRSGKL